MAGSKSTVELNEDGVAAWVDPESYRKYVAAAKSKFEATAENEKATPDGD